MKILAIDYSSNPRSVALHDSEADHGIGTTLATQEEAGKDNLPPTGLIDQTLSSADIRPDSVEGIAIGLGPGSYTGIRLTLAAAQGWQLGCGTPVMGISSALVLAHHAWELNHRGPLNIVINALRREFYLARFQVEETEVTKQEDLRLASFAEVDAMYQEGQALAGPDIQQWFEHGRNLHSPASTLGRLAAADWRPVPAEELQPIYLRPITFVKAPPPRHY